MRRLFTLAAMVMAVPLLSGCILYSDPNGVASFDLFGNPPIQFTLHPSQSQDLEAFWIQNCNDNWDCVVNGLVNTGEITDPIGIEAIEDCFNTFTILGTVCPSSDAQNAMLGRLFTQPGGYPSSTNWENRCLGWGIGVVSIDQAFNDVTSGGSGGLINDPGNEAFKQGTWFWERHGNGYCS